MRSSPWCVKRPHLSLDNSVLTLMVVSPPSSHSVSPRCPLRTAFSRQSDRVCPTGQPFSTHHARHLLSSFPLVHSFHFFWFARSLARSHMLPMSCFWILLFCVCGRIDYSGPGLIRSLAHILPKQQTSSPHCKRDCTVFPQKWEDVCHDAWRGFHRTSCLFEVTGAQK